jgi:RNA methyltransferase, TrmH family
MRMVSAPWSKPRSRRSPPSRGVASLQGGRGGSLRSRGEKEKDEEISRRAPAPPQAACGRPPQRSAPLSAAPPSAEVITSAANPAVALVRSLARRDRRVAEGAFVVEGVRAVQDALDTGAVPRLLLARQGELESWRELALPAQVRARFVERRLFDRLSDVQTPQGILAVFPFPRLIPDPHEPASLVLVLDRLRDPGNLGTLLRSAAGAGVNAVYLTPETVDPWNPKVVRAGMGAHFRIPLVPLDADILDELRQRLPRRVLATAGARCAYDMTCWTGGVALVIGGETEGISPELEEWSTEEVGIPLARGVESLNAAVAGSVILFEAARQRRPESRGGLV